jgi:uncharacterized membrane protein YqaE (UPF0057 family)
VPKILLIVLCLFLPFLAVLIKRGLCIEVLWAFLVQLLGHIPGVIYGMYQDRACPGKVDTVVMQRLPCAQKLARS